MKNFDDISFSIISHDQDDMALKVINSFKDFFPNSRFILTLNKPNKINFKFKDSKRVKVIKNTKPNGFGQNHNQAFKFTNSEFFCVLNPDIDLKDLKPEFNLTELNNRGFSIVSPMQYQDGVLADFLRKYPNFIDIFMRFFLKKNNGSISPKKGEFFDWCVASCIFFKKETYKMLNGFDEKFFMYCEDTDICRRAANLGYKFACTDMMMVNHQSQRDSRKKVTAFYNHVVSMLVIMYRIKTQKNNTSMGVVL